MSQDDEDDCGCNEGWCRDTTGIYRRSFPFGGDHRLLSLHNSAISAEDRATLPLVGPLENKPGVFGFIWGDKEIPGKLPDEGATTFPISPVLAGEKVIWAVTRHSSVPYSALHGHIKYSHATYESTAPEDLFRLYPVGVQHPTHPAGHFVCALNNAGHLFKLPGGVESQADFNFVQTVGVNPGHFWIPDPTPLVANDVVAVLGSAGGDTKSFKAMDLGGSKATAELISTLFALNTKSISTGHVLAASPSIVCHDASTNGGFCGSVGINVTTYQGFKFSFIHVGGYGVFEARPEFLHNHGLSVLDPDFRNAYVAHVLPSIIPIAAQLSPAQVTAIRNYVGNAAWPP